MNHNLHITYFKPEKQGVYPIKNGCSFAACMESANECGLILYDKEGGCVRIPFSKEGKRGALYGVKIEGKNLPYEAYNFYDGDRVFTDPYAKSVLGLEQFGDFGNQKRATKGVLFQKPFHWEKDKSPAIPYHDTIIYGLNVRAFTMHRSSGVRHKGTFEGVAEKADYLKSLGITAVELMPSYEFDECIYLSDAAKRSMREAAKNCTVSGNSDKRLNCWGYQQGFYFAPKASYSAGRPEISFKKMVKTLHENGIEVMMQFYFPAGMKGSYILDILRYWVIEYHIDGVRLSGFNLPLTLIAQDPLLKETKIRSSYLPIEEIYGETLPFYKNLAVDNGNYRNDMRRFLKGDENLINQALFYQRNNPAKCAVVNYLADYDGFSLFDSVSYERKHNEANGENNSDGTDCNLTWNCGAEGESRRKAILALRQKQLKNALSFLFLCQGVPYLFSGDEFGNTRFGNNNAYCQDNETGWVKWKNNQFSKELLYFTKKLIAFRKKHPILHLEKELRILDYISCGYPDISYHGAEAWRPDTSYTSRMAGIMLCGKYAEGSCDNSFYIALNMHWEPKELALPKLPKGKKWTKLLSTSSEAQKEIPSDKNKAENKTGHKTENIAENKIKADGRSISLYLSETDGEFEKGKTAKRKTANKE